LTWDERNKVTVRQSLHEKAFRSAEGNWVAAEVLYAQLHEGAGFVLYSYAMLAGLAVELYLKSLVHLEERNRDRIGKGRFGTKSLCELYQMLSQESRFAIRDCFNASAREFAPLPLPESIPADVRALARNGVVTYDFDGTLMWMSESFADFRYAFERPHCLVVLPTNQALRNAVRKRILELAPELDRRR
jgi:hypothetical protein